MEVHRAESLNDSPVFVRALADIVAKHLHEGAQPDTSTSNSTSSTSTITHTLAPTSVQMGLRCPGCTNATCAQQKSWFARAGI